MKKKANKGLILGTLGGGTIGAAIGASTGKKNKKKKSAIKGGLVGAAYGAVGGKMYDDIKAFEKAFGSGRGKFTSSIDDDLKTIGIKNKKEFTRKVDVKRKHRKAVFKHHPDKGGDPEKMKKVNSSWEKISNSDWYEKLAFLRQRGFSKADCCMVKHAGVMDWVHGGLDLAGLVPGLGIPFDLANAALYGARGQAGNAALSLGAAVPLAGYGANAVKAGKHINKAIKAGDKVTDVSKAKKVMDAVKAPVQTTRDATRKAVSSTETGKKVLDKSDAISKGIADATGGGKTTKVIQGAQVLTKGEKATRPKPIDKALDKVITEPIAKGVEKLID